MDLLGVLISSTAKRIHILRSSISINLILLIYITILRIKKQPIVTSKYYNLLMCPFNY